MSLHKNQSKKAEIDAHTSHNEIHWRGAMIVAGVTWRALPSPRLLACRSSRVGGGYTLNIARSHRYKPPPPLTPATELAPSGIAVSLPMRYYTLSTKIQLF